MDIVIVTTSWPLDVNNSEAENTKHTAVSSFCAPSSFIFSSVSAWFARSRALSALVTAPPSQLRPPHRPQPPPPHRLSHGSPCPSQTYRCKEFVSMHGERLYRLLCHFPQFFSSVIAQQLMDGTGSLNQLLSLYFRSEDLTVTHCLTGPGDLAMKWSCDICQNEELNVRNTPLLV